MEADALWPSPPADLALPGDEVHVWRAVLDLPPAAVMDLRRLLAADEQERADRFHFEQDRRHFIAARGMLRLLLGRYLRTAPEQLQFTYNPYGKPDLAAGPDAHPLRFNVSHSHGLALYAVTQGRRIGVDVE